MELPSAPLVLLTQLVVGEDSVDIEDARNELRMELIVLNADLSELNKKWDFSAVLRPLLEDQGPAMAQTPRLEKQKERMAALREDFLRKEQERNFRKEQEQPQAVPLPAAAPRRVLEDLEKDVQILCRLPFNLFHKMQ
jgi:hypothetical protein